MLQVRLGCILWAFDGLGHKRLFLQYINWSIKGNNSSVIIKAIFKLSGYPICDVGI